MPRFFHIFSFFSSCTWAMLFIHSTFLPRTSRTNKKRKLENGVAGSRRWRRVLEGTQAYCNPALYRWTPTYLWAPWKCDVLMAGRLKKQFQHWALSPPPRGGSSCWQRFKESKGAPSETQPIKLHTVRPTVPFLSQNQLSMERRVRTSAGLTCDKEKSGSQIKAVSTQWEREGAEGPGGGMWKPFIWRTRVFQQSLNSEHISGLSCKITVLNLFAGFPSVITKYTSG